MVGARMRIAVSACHAEFEASKMDSAGDRRCFPMSRIGIRRFEDWVLGSYKAEDSLSLNIWAVTLEAVERFTRGEFPQSAGA